MNPTVIGSAADRPSSNLAEQTTVICQILKTMNFRGRKRGAGEVFLLSAVPEAFLWTVTRYREPIKLGVPGTLDDEPLLI
jgi:hypothetical protein